MKKLLIGVLVLAALLGGAAYWAYNKIDVIVHFAIERYGPDVLGVAVKVKDVEIDPADGRGALKGVEIGAPRGYGSPRTARVAEIRVAVDPATVRDAVIVIREITVIAPEIHYEKATSGATNLDAIQRNIDAYLQSAGTPVDGNAAAGPKSAGRRYVIEKLTIRNARVTMTNAGLKGQGITFTLPDIQLSNIGRKPDGITAGQAASLVTSALITRIAQRLLTNIDLLRRGGTEGALDALKSLLK